MKQKRSKRARNTVWQMVMILLVVVCVLAANYVLGRDEKPAGTDVGNDEAVADERSSGMEVHFIDVGQGDATLIKADGHAMLIDSGENDQGTAVQLYLKKQRVEQLDYLVLTHTDSDHIGGADVIISKFDIGQIFLSDFKKDNQTYRELMDSMRYQHIDRKSVV